jgi:hypothetical protein
MRLASIGNAIDRFLAPLEGADAVDGRAHDPPDCLHLQKAWSPVTITFGARLLVSRGLINSIAGCYLMSL